MKRSETLLCSIICAYVNKIFDIVHNSFEESSYEQNACVARSCPDRYTQFDNFEINTPEEGFGPKPV